MSFFKKYFLVFLVNYLLLVISKLLFSFYLGFDEVYAVFWGFKFDFAVSAFVAFIVMLFSFSKILSKIVFVGLTISFFFIQIGDILYFSETHRHIGYEIEDFFVDFIPLLATAFSQYFFISVIASFFGLLLIFLLWRIDLSEKFTKFTGIKIIFALALSIFFIRGEFQHIPLHPYQANEIGDVQKAQVALNGIYNISYALMQAKKEPKMLALPKPSKSLIQKSFIELYNERNETSSSQLILENKKPNVVLFFAESWSAKWLQPYGFEKDVTPNFTQLYKKGLSVKYMIANGHRTTEGIFATLTSFPNPLGKTIAKTSLQSYQYDSMIYLFNDAGYQSIFFQGTSKDTSGTGSLAQSLGFASSYGKRDITKRKYPMNYWGVQDDDLYDFVFTKLPNDKPFIIGINGATTHDSVIPESFAKKEFVKDENLNNSLNALHFADYSLGKFIQKMEEKYPNTIFVFFADHCGGYLSGNLENYKIPFVIYSKNIKAQHKDVVLSQMDIAPTVVDLVFGNYKKLLPNATGKSFFSDKHYFAPYFHNGILGWIENNKIIEYNLQNDTLKCEDNESSCTELKNHLLSYTYITQKLLFEGKTREFHKYRYLNLKNKE
jgi:phosphoglycerol transferase MdoB-like AlkP superfamily enzyme